MIHSLLECGSSTTVFEPSTDNDFDDLRITEPFQSLREYVDSVDLDKLDSAKQAHIPYIVILLKAIDRWREKVELLTGFVGSLRRDLFIRFPK